MGFAVTPITDCPHVPAYVVDEVDYLHKPCQSCDDTTENWHCLHCKAVYCSRYCKGHMKKHVDETDHCVCISFSDLSVWCYQCDNYILDESLHAIKHKLYVLKFGQEPPSGSASGNDGSSSSSK
ncbi:uncharacterized protein EV154DRAFT_485149 [Mucor mucedo]|uniref:uncharacterized protein n=1 Tax=Mucor mucedo TaxID=29922 RepID=UPI00222102FF|nr:uncharacterized protein EV154DRAFT_485149 [Mucor mucedo]KAI7886399.1 hypothetical protein EV154DRAFT_485149 [Mucor mucedo]